MGDGPGLRTSCSTLSYRIMNFAMTFAKSRSKAFSSSASVVGIPFPSILAQASSPDKVRDTGTRALQRKPKTVRTSSWAVQESRLPRVVCDGMLGDVAQWLRLFGLDADYAGSQALDEYVLAEARRQQRALITRDRDLAAKARQVGHPVIEVPPLSLDESVAFVLKGLGGPPVPQAWLTRCSVCNGRLMLIGRREVEAMVPSRVAQHHPEFRQCLGCARIYWEGTHVEGIRSRLHRIGARVLQGPGGIDL